MKALKKLLLDIRGNTSLWAGFVLLLMCSICILVYSAGMIYSKYQSAQTELERAGSIAVDRNMENRDVRELELDIPPAPTLSDLEGNLANAGWVRNAKGLWEKWADGKLLYALGNLQAEVNEDWMDITGTFSMPLPWAMDGRFLIDIPIVVKSKVIYLD